MVKNYIAVLSANHAVHVYKANYSITNLKGETGPELPQTVTTVWVRKNGEWKILHSHDSWSGKAIEAPEEKEAKK